MLLNTALYSVSVTADHLLFRAPSTTPTAGSFEPSAYLHQLVMKPQRMRG